MGDRKRKAPDDPEPPKRPRLWGALAYPLTLLATFLWDPSPPPMPIDNATEQPPPPPPRPPSPALDSDPTRSPPAQDPAPTLSTAPSPVDDDVTRLPPPPLLVAPDSPKDRSAAIAQQLIPVALPRPVSPEDDPLTAPVPALDPVAAVPASATDAAAAAPITDLSDQAAPPLASPAAATAVAATAPIDDPVDLTDQTPPPLALTRRATTFPQPHPIHSVAAAAGPSTDADPEPDNTFDGADAANPPTDADMASDPAEEGSSVLTRRPTLAFSRPGPGAVPTPPIGAIQPPAEPTDLNDTVPELPPQSPIPVPPPRPTPGTDSRDAADLNASGATTQSDDTAARNWIAGMLTVTPADTAISTAAASPPPPTVPSDAVPVAPTTDPTASMPPPPPISAIGPDVYGTLVVLGPREGLMDNKNQVLDCPSELNEDFVLRRRAVGNGIKLSRATRMYLETHSPHHEPSVPFTHLPRGPQRTARVANDSDDSDGIPDAREPRAASISLSAPASRAYTKAVQFDFVRDANFDMWQFGRMEPPRNDWQIIGYHNNTDFPMSRYAFRVLACRRTGRCWVSAGGFDERKMLFLNPYTIRWGSPPYDAFTTCGLLLWTPQLGTWCEVSVLGHMYSLRPSHEAGGRRLLGTATNELTDGALLHVGGTTLVFRRGDFHEEPTACHSAVLQGLKALQRVRPTCPIQIETLSFIFKPGGWASHASVDAVPSVPTADGAPQDSGSGEPVSILPLVFPACGHLLSNHTSNTVLDTCPICRKKGPLTQLRFDYHRALLAPDQSPGHLGAPTHVFNPCGHLTFELQAKHWAGLCIPGVSNHFVGDWCTGRAVCPFCNEALDGQQPFTKLHLS